MVSASRPDPSCVASYHTDNSLKWLGGARKPIGIIVVIGIPLQLAHIYREHSQIEKSNVSSSRRQSSTLAMLDILDITRTCR